jgi:hypothetical protein
LPSVGVGGYQHHGGLGGVGHAQALASNVPLHRLVVSARQAGRIAATMDSSAMAAVKMASPLASAGRYFACCASAAETRQRQAAQYEAGQKWNRRYKAALLFEDLADFNKTEARAAVRFRHSHAEQAGFRKQLPQALAIQLTAFAELHQELVSAVFAQDLVGQLADLGLFFGKGKIHADNLAGHGFAKK